MTEKHKKEIEKLRMKEMEMSHNPLGSNGDDLAQQMAADMININDIINV